MLLYQIATWFEERGLLKKAVSQEDGGTPEQIEQLKEVEWQLSKQAERFVESYSRAPFIQEPYMAPHLDDDAYI